MRAPRSVLQLAVLACFVGVGGVVGANGCNCSEPVDGEGEGDVVVGEGEGEGEEGEGEEGEGEGEEGEGEGEGEGEVVDGGNGFDLGGLLDGGVLDCLPSELPELSVSGALDALALSPYAGRRENGVKCDDVTCDDDVPCCVLCGFGACAVDLADAGNIDCPAFTQAYACDGDEECGNREVCCFTLQGSECRDEAACDFDVGSALGQFFADGGFSLPDGGPPVDGGFLDGGFAPVVAVDGGFADGGFVDGGFNVDGGPVDGGSVTGAPLDGGFGGGEPLDGGPGPQLDAGSLVDAIQDTFEQGVPTCHSSLFDNCDLLNAEICCASDRLSSVDVGFCLPALLCAGDFLP